MQLKNTWNIRSESGYRRSRNFSRPWYVYGSELIRANLNGSRRKSALDVGCGVGEFMEILEQDGFEVTGVDGNADQIETVKNNGLEGRVVDLEKQLPFERESFDLVTSLEVIEHIACAESLLKEINRVLKSGGHLLITTPNFAYLNHRLQYLFGAAPWNEGIHLRYFTKSRLLSCLNQTGFEVIAQKSYGPMPLVSTLMLRLLKCQPPLWCVNGHLESILANDLIYLVKKT